MSDRLLGWTVGLVFVPALVAFPIVLILAWMFDLGGAIEMEGGGIEAGTAGTAVGS